MDTLRCAALRATRLAALGLALVLAPALALAAPEEGPSPTAAGSAPQEHAEEADETGAETRDEKIHGEHANGLSLFVGTTNERVDGASITEKGFTFGVEYFRRLTPRFSLGGVVERAGGDIRATLVVAQAYYRVVGGLHLTGGPGVEFRDASPEEPAQLGQLSTGTEDPTREGDKTVFLIRIGALYEFELDRWIITPNVAIDFFGRDEALVLGVGVGYVF